ncbi:hypothetical protein GCM10009835_48320 [Planosporangium flavigriseum]|uniref:Uncharacterized protein n=1 Tax=Planosporangium flavigriseum TaxID=373681 RepID=A0A8J3LMG9_9ACTN|nr:hypothetical protein Pfl04_38510 [Planosporangium flavigriseum]
MHGQDCPGDALGVGGLIRFGGYGPPWPQPDEGDKGEYRRRNQHRETCSARPRGHLYPAVLSVDVTVDVTVRVTVSPAGIGSGVGVGVVAHVFSRRGCFSPALWVTRSDWATRLRDATGYWTERWTWLVWSPEGVPSPLV